MALVLITLANIKNYIPLYADYLTDAAAARSISVDDLLEQEAEFAEAEFMAGMPGVAAIADITADFTRMLVDIIHYRVFMIKHGDTEFKTDPLVVQNYKKTKDRIDGGKTGAGRINMTPAFDRIMDKSMVNVNDAEPQPTSEEFR